MKAFLRHALMAFPMFLFGAGSAEAECKLTFKFDIPVTMNRFRPLADAKINGVPGQFIVDSGAFYSLLSPGIAAAAKVKLTPAPDWFHLTGVGGSTTASYTRVKDISLAGTALPPL